MKEINHAAGTYSTRECQPILEGHILRPIAHVLTVYREKFRVVSKRDAIVEFVNLRTRRLSQSVHLLAYMDRDEIRRAEGHLHADILKLTTSTS